MILLSSTKLRQWATSATTPLPIYEMTSKLSQSQQTLLLLYASPESAVPVEDLISWIEHSSVATYRRDVLKRLHKARLVEYDRETEMAVISPTGIAKVEADLLRRK
jgi:hypothetical protein